MGETTAQVASASRAAQAATIAEALRLTAEDHPDRVAMRTKDDEVSLTWSGLRDRVDALAGGLARLGVRRGDTVALMLANRPEFAIADLAVITLGATPYSIYATSSPAQIAYAVADAASRVAIVEESFSGAFLAARDNLPDLDTMVVLEHDHGVQVREVVAGGQEGAAEALLDDRHARGGVRDRVGDLRGRGGGVDGVRRGAERDHREVRDRELRPVGQHQRDGVATPDSEASEAAGQ